MKDTIMFSWVPIVITLLTTAGIFWGDGQKRFAVLFLVITIALGILEAESKIHTGLTLSQNFINYHNKHPMSSWLAMYMSMTAQSFLWMHLLSGK